MTVSLSLLPFLLMWIPCNVWSVTGGEPVAGGSWWPATLAETPALPDPQSQQVVMWLLIGLLALVAFLGTAAGGVLTFWTLLDKARGKRDTVSVEGQMETRPSQAGPSRIEFDHHVDQLRELRDERKEDVREMKGSLREIGEKLDRFSGDQYKARGAMHRRVNTMENAMHFWAGKMAGQGDPDAQRLREILSGDGDHSAGGDRS